MANAAELGAGPFLVTGGAGFIGSHLVEALVARGAKVVVVDNLSTGMLGNLTAVSDDITFQQLDLRHDDLRPLLAAQQFRTVFHLAANASVPLSVQAPQVDFETNAVTTLRVLEAVREVAPAARVIHTSSAAVYGQGGADPIREDRPTVPVSPYGVSKLTSEHYVSVYAGVYGLQTANLRLFSAYGPRLRKQVVFDLLRKIHDNPAELFIFGDGTQVRDFNHVSNVIEALLVVAAQPALRGEVYNVAAEVPLSIGELAALLCRRMQASPRFVYSGEVRPGEAERWEADTARIRALGYRGRMGLAEGLDDTVAWFRREVGAPATKA